MSNRIYRSRTFRIIRFNIVLSNVNDSTRDQGRDIWTHGGTDQSDDIVVVGVSSRDPSQEPVMNPISPSRCISPTTPNIVQNAFTSSTRSVHQRKIHEVTGKYPYGLAAFVNQEINKSD